MAGQITAPVGTQRPAFTPPHTCAPLLNRESSLFPLSSSTQRRNKGKSQLSSLSPSLFPSLPSPSCALNPQSYPWTSTNIPSGSVDFGFQRVQSHLPLLESLITSDRSGLVNRIRAFDSTHLPSLHFRRFRKLHHPFWYG